MRTIPIIVVFIFLKLQKECFLEKIETDIIEGKNTCSEARNCVDGLMKPTYDENFIIVGNMAEKNVRKCSRLSFYSFLKVNDNVSSKLT